MTLPSAQRGSLRGGAASVVFWTCLFVAGGLYGAVVLSPKLLAHAALQAQFSSNQWRLVELERQVERLEAVVAAQRNDPSFIREQARSDFSVSAPDEQRIPVESHLTLRIGQVRTERTSSPPASPLPIPLLKWITESRKTSNLLLCTAALLVVGAFTLLPPTKEQ
ncbi:MAG: septum formation initiator family protein [Planctomycetales bacterium]